MNAAPSNELLLGVHVSRRKKYYKSSHFIHCDSNRMAHSCILFMLRRYSSASSIFVKAATGSAKLVRTVRSERIQPSAKGEGNHLLVISTAPSLDTEPRMHPITLLVEGGAAGRRLWWSRMEKKTTGCRDRVRRNGRRELKAGRNAQENRKREPGHLRTSRRGC